MSHALESLTLNFVLELIFKLEEATKLLQGPLLVLKLAQIMLSALLATTILIIKEARNEMFSSFSKSYLSNIAECFKDF